MDEFTAESTGRTVHLRAVPLRLVLELTSKPEYRDPPVPTYAVQAAGGVELTYPHNATTLETDEERATWAAYEAERDAVSLRRQIATQEFLFYNSVVEEPDPPEQWRFDFALWGLAPPDPSDRVAFKRRWIEEEICPDVRDLSNLILRLYALSGISDDIVKQIESFFRSALAGQGPGRLGRRAHPARQGAKRG